MALYNIYPSVLYTEFVSENVYFWKKITLVFQNISMQLHLQLLGAAALLIINNCSPPLILSIDYW